MSAVVADTSLFIRTERGDAQAVDRLGRLLTERWGIASVTLYELTCRAGMPPELRDFYDDLFALGAVHPVTREAAELAAAASAARSSPWRAPDALIAGVAAARGARVVTADSGFPRLPGLEVELVFPS
ncbi:MAG TPA: PIN domain-containing protein [Anaeromyxobacteraceae bacterium]|nr:PIN domain-containing protein [Anaeromyxobacteraceae bacterium]